MSNPDREADAFGTGGGAEAAAEADMALQQEMQERPGQMDPERRVRPSPKRATPGGLPIGAWVGIGLFAVVMLVTIMTIIASKMNATRREDALRIAGAERGNSEQTQFTSLRADLQAMQDAVRSLQDSQRQLRERLDKGVGANELQLVDQRLSRIESLQKSSGTEMSVLTKRLYDARPFEAEMYIRDELEIISVGNGIARVRDRSGKEFSLRKGDRFGSLRVTSVRADRWQITFSDGSVVI